MEYVKCFRKEKQNEKLLSGIMNNFLNSITNSEVKTILKENSYITGGCIPSMLLGEFVTDYDIYFYNKEDVEKIIEYFKTKNEKDNTNSLVITEENKGKFHVKLITENAINLSDKIQLITKFIGDPVFVTEKFDWEHIKSYFYFDKIEDKYKLVLTQNVYQLICEKELIYTGSDYPLSSLMRLKKYIKKGWNVSNTTILHIALDIVASFNNLENQRQFKKAKHGIEQLQKINNKIKNMTQEEFDELSDFPHEIETIEDSTHELHSFDVITHPVELNFIDKAVKQSKQQTFNVEDIIYHLNGVDPITVQGELMQKIGEYLTIEDIIKIMNHRS